MISCISVSTDHCTSLSIIAADAETWSTRFHTSSTVLTIRNLNMKNIQLFSFSVGFSKLESLFFKVRVDTGLVSSLNLQNKIETTFVTRLWYMLWKLLFQTAGLGLGDWKGKHLKLRKLSANNSKANEIVLETSFWNSTKRQASGLKEL